MQRKANLPRDRTELSEGNLTLKAVQKQDHGYYECHVKNEIMDLVAVTKLFIEGICSTKHAPRGLYCP